MTKKEIKKIIDAVISLRNAATDEQANDAKDLYPEWREDKEYHVGERVRHNGKLYKVGKDHISERESFESGPYTKI